MIPQFNFSIYEEIPEPVFQEMKQDAAKEKTDDFYEKLQIDF